MVFGGEVGFGALSLGGSRTAADVPYVSGCCNFTINELVRTNWLLTVRPRVGWAFEPSDSWLFDLSAGLALTDLGSSSSFLDTPGGVAEAASKTQTKAGWTAGTSLAYALDDHWSAKLEYLFVDFGDVSSNGTSNSAGFSQTFSHTADLTAHIVRAVVNYKF
jgi:outer membrane immunogenic protein